jgi:hypothetical protein
MLASEMTKVINPADEQGGYSTCQVKKPIPYFTGAIGSHILLNQFDKASEKGSEEEHFPESSPGFMPFLTG